MNLSITPPVNCYPPPAGSPTYWPQQSPIDIKDSYAVKFPADYFKIAYPDSFSGEFTECDMQAHDCQFSPVAGAKVEITFDGLRWPLKKLHFHTPSEHQIDGAKVGPRRNITMPGVAVSVGEQIEALRRIAGENVVKLIRDEHDETTWAIVKNWATRFEGKRARELGFTVESSFDEIIRAHIEDELGGKVPS